MLKPLPLASWRYIDRSMEHDKLIGVTIYYELKIRNRKENGRNNDGLVEEEETANNEIERPVCMRFEKG